MVYGGAAGAGTGAAGASTASLGDDVMPSFDEDRPSSPTKHSMMTTTTAPDTDANANVASAGPAVDSAAPLSRSPSPPLKPLPVKQLGLLALLSLAEQTALNSISPYLPSMVASFPEIPQKDTGLYVGLLASSFALAQLATNLLWGYLSDRVGRKPVVLLGSSFLALCFALFGFCTSYAQVLAVHVSMGLLNGNAAVVPTCLGEVTDRRTQSSAFTWLPVIYSLGSITGPALGGLLVGRHGWFSPAAYPFLAPNLVGSALLAAAVVVLFVWFDETLDRGDQQRAPEWWEQAGRFLKHHGGRCLPWGRRDYEAVPSTGVAVHGVHGVHGVQVAGGDDSGSDSADETTSLLKPQDPRSSALSSSSFRRLLRYQTVILLATYIVFQLANISFNSLFPIFASTPEPTGRGLSPEHIGLLASLAGGSTMLFQVTLFPGIKARIGNMRTYRGALLGLALSMALMPLVPRKSGAPVLGMARDRWLYVASAAILVGKNICAVGGLSSVMLLITNSAPSSETLGTLNGIAQTLSAAGRSIGPFVSGALFTLSTRLPRHGELLAWWVFGGIAIAGWAVSFGIDGRGLESADWQGLEGEADEGEQDLECEP